MSGVFQVEHPLIASQLTRLRDRATPPAEFRSLVSRLASLLAYEALKDLQTEPITVETPLTKTAGCQLTQRIGLVPILRAGLGMVEPILELIPQAEVWHLGVYRDEATAKPVRYYNKLPHERPVDVALVVDPMLATGGSAVAAMTTPTHRSMFARSILSSTTANTSCPASATPATASSTHSRSNCTL
jgi:uracil phosphoribosyltransferase